MKVFITPLPPAKSPGATAPLLLLLFLAIPFLHPYHVADAQVAACQTATYTCSAANTRPVYNISLAAGGTATLCTDSDGAGTTANYAANMICRLIVRCPAGMFAVAFWSGRVGNTGDNLRFISGGVTSTVTPTSTNAQSNIAFYFHTNVGDYHFTSDGTTSAVGITLTMACRFSRCPTYTTATAPVFTQWGRRTSILLPTLSAATTTDRMCFANSD